MTSQIHSSTFLNNKSASQNELSFQFRQHANVFLILREKLQRNKHLVFKESQSSFSVFFAVQLLVSIYMIIKSYFTTVEYNTILATFNLVWAIVSVVVVGWILVVLKLLAKRPNIPPPLSMTWVSALESLWLVGFCVWYGIAVILVGVNGHCKDSGYSFGCNISSPHQMPEDNMLCALMVPIVFYVIVKGAHWECVVFSFVFNLIANFFTLFYFNLTVSLYSLLIFLPFSALVTYEYQRQQVSLFLMSEKQKWLLAENERLADETHATEMRHMIGNVAHDLKTPLTAFVSGVELINTIVDEIRCRNSSEGDLDSSHCKYIQEQTESIKENVDNVLSINAFMLMSINRCIDFTKATNGMKLVPRLETIGLRETVDLPIRCMKVLQTARINIALAIVADDIVPNIITDKQWLQENILCLLSNAVKYSTHGTVNVCLCLRNQSTASTISNSSAILPSRDFNTDEQSVGDTQSAAVHMRPPRLIQVGSPKASSSHQWLRIEVEDTGIGMSDEAMAALFQPFKQAQRMAGGTGLGLYSLAKRMEALNGTFGVLRRPDGLEGSVFWFEIPYRPDASKSPSPMMYAPSNLRLKELKQSSSIYPLEVATRSESGEMTAAETPMSKKMNAPPSSFASSPMAAIVLRILVVDDSPAIVKMSGAMLRRKGHMICTAENGAEALQMMTDDKNGTAPPFDVVLMDLQMPVMDGLESTRRLRAMEQSRSGSSKRNSISSSDSAKALLNQFRTLKNSHKYMAGSETQSAQVFVRTVGNTEISMRRSEASRSSKSRAHLLVIGVSANSDTDTVAEAFDAGVDAFIPKPFTLQSFNDTYARLTSDLH